MYFFCLCLNTHQTRAPNDALLENRTAGPKNKALENRTHDDKNELSII